jgi:hypothetical protein
MEVARGNVRYDGGWRGSGCGCDKSKGETAQMRGTDKRLQAE